MFSQRITLVAMALFGSLGAGLAQAQGADVPRSVTIGSPVGVPVYNQGVPVYGITDARSTACTGAHAAGVSAAHPLGS